MNINCIIAFATLLAHSVFSPLWIGNARGFFSEDSSPFKQEQGVEITSSKVQLYANAGLALVAVIYPYAAGSNHSSWGRDDALEMDAQVCIPLLNYFNAS